MKTFGSALVVCLLCLSGCAGVDITPWDGEPSAAERALLKQPVQVTLLNEQGEVVQQDQLPVTVRLAPDGEVQEGVYRVRLGSAEEPLATFSFSYHNDQWSVGQHPVEPGFTRWLVLDVLSGQLWLLPPEEVNELFSQQTDYTNLIISQKNHLADQHYPALIPFNAN